MPTIRQRIAQYIAGTQATGNRAPIVASNGRSVDALVEHLRKAYGLGGDDSRAGSLALIHRGAVYACATLRADMLSGLPIRLYQREDNPTTGRAVNVRMLAGGKARVAPMAGAIEVESSPVLDVINRPNQDWTGRQFIRMTELGLGLVGQAHWQLHRGDAGTAKPSGMSWVKHSRLDVIKPGSGDAPANAPDDARTVAGWWVDKHTAGASKLLPTEILWLRYPDPEDPDYGALAPAGIAALGANTYHEAMYSNRTLFRDGLRAAGAFVPPVEMESFGWDQADEITRDVNAMMMGAANTHKVPVFPYRFDFQSFGVSPKDAEFVAMMDFAIEDVARAYRVPIEMVGGTRRTYQNAEVADIALWQRALEPEAAWIADEMSARLLPAFGLDPAEYFIAFDLTGVVALQADETAEWNRQREQIASGVLLPSEWRAKAGLPELETQGASIEVGKVGAILSALTSMGQGLVTAESVTALIVEAIGLSPQAAAAIVGSGPPPMPEPDDTPDATDTATAANLADWLRGLDRAAAGATAPPTRAAPPYGSDDHARIMRAADDALGPHEARMRAAVQALFRDQQKSILEKLGAGEGERAARLGIGDVFAMFDRARWVKRFREVAMRQLAPTMTAAGDATYDDVGADGAYNPKTPAAIRALRQQSQRFAVEVNRTTWDALKAQFEEGMAAGETQKQLAARVEATMGTAIRSRSDVIARTETHTAYQRGSLIAAKETGLELVKVWQSALDSRVRDDHQDAHGQERALDEDFEVGGASGPGPGQLGAADQDINCRCAVTYERADKGRAAIIGGNHADSTRA